MKTFELYDFRRLLLMIIVEKCYALRVILSTLDFHELFEYLMFTNYSNLHSKDEIQLLPFHTDYRIKQRLDCFLYLPLAQNEVLVDSIRSTRNIVQECLEKCVEQYQTETDIYALYTLNRWMSEFKYAMCISEDCENYCKELQYNKCVRYMQHIRWIVEGYCSDAILKSFNLLTSNVLVTDS